MLVAVVELNFSFVRHTPDLDGAPHELDLSYMTFYDMDSGADDVAWEFFQVRGRTLDLT